MHVCALMRKIRRNVGLYESRKGGVQQYLTFVEDRPDVVWEKSLEVFRQEHSAVLNDIVPPLLKSRDKLFRILLIRSADLKKRRELNLLKELAHEADPVLDQPELLAILERWHKGLSNEVRERGDLTSKLRSIVGPK